MILAKSRKLLAGVAAATVILAFGFAYAQQGPRGKSSYMPVDIPEPFSAIFARLSPHKPEVTREHTALLNEPYALSHPPPVAVKHLAMLFSDRRTRTPAFLCLDSSRS